MEITQWLKLHKRYERYAYPKFKKALEASYRPFVAMIPQLNYSNYTNLTENFVTKKPIFAAYVEVYTKIGLKHGSITGKEINRHQKAYTDIVFGGEYSAMIY